MPEVMNTPAILSNSGGLLIDVQEARIHLVGDDAGSPAGLSGGLGLRSGGLALLARLLVLEEVVDDDVPGRGLHAAGAVVARLVPHADADELGGQALRDAGVPDDDLGAAHVGRDAGRDDQIVGLGGNDTIAGAGGSDEIVGGDGNDFLLGEFGGDTLTGDAGDDDLFERLQHGSSRGER